MPRWRCRRWSSESFCPLPSWQRESPGTSPPRWRWDWAAGFSSGSWPIKESGGTFSGAGVAFALLFHTHLVTFATLCGAGLVVLPVMLRQERGPVKLMAAAGVAVLGIVPWVLLAGFHERLGDAPLAWSLLSFPGDAVSFLLRSRRATFLVCVLIASVPAVCALRSVLPTRFVGPFLEARKAHAFLVAWLGVGYLAATFCYPAASYFLDRIYFCLVPPAVLLGALVVATAARAVMPSKAAPLAVLLAAILLVGSRLGVLELRHPRARSELAREEIPVFEMVEHLRGREIEPGTRLYATPNNHLSLMIYTGLPVQSVAPVRRQFLDSYDGPLLILDCVARYYPLRPEEVALRAREAGVELSPSESSHWSVKLNRRLTQEDLQGKVASIEPPMDEMPAWCAPLLEAARTSSRERIATRSDTRENPAVFRGFTLNNFADWWPIFFYRFVGPEERLGDGLNYAARIRSCRATVLRKTWVIYDCPR